jgi:hypothetical protein
VAALNAHELSTARSLLTPPHERVVEDAPDSFFTNTKSITSLHVNRPFVIHQGLPMRVGVGVTFDLQQHNVESMPNGQTTWGYFLIRSGPNKRWLIYDEGTG